MNIRDRQGLRSRAAQALADAAVSPAKLALLHSGAAVALSLVLTVLNVILTEMISDTGGLSGMGMRSVLSTAKAMLGILSMVVMPFWELGFVYAALKIARGQSGGFGDMLRGFRRFGPVLRLKLLELALYMAIIILGANIGSSIFLMTPYAAPLMEAMMAAEVTTPEALMEAMGGNMLPMYAIAAVVVCVLLVPVWYRFRMAQYLIVDDPAIGALAALGTSHRLMRHNRFALFRLDLSLWWYYGLQMICAIAAYSDLLADSFGLQLPFSATAALFIAFAIYALVRLAVAWYCDSPVAVTYAAAYDALQEMQKDAEPRVTKNFPWDFLPERAPEDAEE